MIKARLLIVDDEEVNLVLFARRLEKLSYKVYTADSGVNALQILQDEEIDMLITDFRMPGMDGAEIIAKAHEIDPELQSIVVTGYGDLKTAIDVMGAGAFNFFQKPIDFGEVDFAIQKGLEKRVLLQEVKNKQVQLEKYREHLEELVEERTRILTETNLRLKSEIEERKTLENSLREAKVVAEKANKAKSEFLANMSHEIRTPMTSIIGLLNLVLDSELLPKQKAYLEMTRISTVIMHNLLNDILDFSKIEAGKLILESISFDPRTVVKSIIDLQHLQAEEKKINIFYSIDDDVPQSVTGDPNRLRQILLNLVSNAIKFTHYGEVSIRCKCLKDEDPKLPTLGDKYKVLQFSVQDSGIGIDKDKMELIFEAFTQADNSTTRKFGGVGLGLNICSKLVEMMRGHLWVTSEPGQGSTFHFTCRLGAEHVRGEVEGNVKKQRDILQGKNPLTVLVVEDDPVNQWVIHEILENVGCSVIAVSGGVEALQEVKNRCIDIVLLDLHLPDMSGYEVVRKIRNCENNDYKKSNDKIYIIAMTGLAGETEKEKCLIEGMNDFIYKPFTSDQIIPKMRKFISYKKPICIDSKKIKKNSVKNDSFVKGDVFNIDIALSRAFGDINIVAGRVNTFLSKIDKLIEIFNINFTTVCKVVSIERDIFNLKELAIEISAINLADELLSLLMHIRSNSFITSDNVNCLKSEIYNFKNDENVILLIGGKV